MLTLAGRLRAGRIEELPLHPWIPSDNYSLSHRWEEYDDSLLTTYTITWDGVQIYDGTTDPTSNDSLGRHYYESGGFRYTRSENRTALSGDSVYYGLTKTLTGVEPVEDADNDVDIYPEYSGADAGLVARARIEFELWPDSENHPIFLSSQFNQSFVGAYVGSRVAIVLGNSDFSTEYTGNVRAPTAFSPPITQTGSGNYFTASAGSTYYCADIGDI